jgi:hypothetical protein
MTDECQGPEEAAGSLRLACETLCSPEDIVGNGHCFFHTTSITASVVVICVSRLKCVETSRAIGSHNEDRGGALAYIPVCLLLQMAL